MLATCHGIAQRPIIIYAYAAAVLLLIIAGNFLLLFSPRQRARWQALKALPCRYHRPLTRR